MASLVLQSPLSLIHSFINSFINPFPPNLQNIITPTQMSGDRCHFSHVRYHVSRVTCQVSGVGCHMSCVIVLVQIVQNYAQWHNLHYAQHDAH